MYCQARQNIFCRKGWVRVCGCLADWGGMGVANIDIGVVLVSSIYDYNEGLVLA